MRIAFIGGTLEPGRDGVGDYTRGLADECRRLGHEVLLIGLKDKFATEPDESESLEGEPVARVLRYPACQSIEESVAAAAKEVERFQPDWVSLQFVCYMYHQKGLCFGLAQALKPLVKGRALHVMFHETWLCREMGWGWKQQLVGNWQRWLILRLMAAFAPKVVHTSNEAYQRLLRKAGLNAEMLELFGAIPLTDEAEGWFMEELVGRLREWPGRDKVWILGFFGAIHAQWVPDLFMSLLLETAAVQERKPVICSIGRTGEAGRKIWDDMVACYSCKADFCLLEEQSTARISDYLRHLDFGIATTPYSILGKSSTAVSMLEHGAPVIVSRDDMPGDSPLPDQRWGTIIKGLSNLKSVLPEAKRSPGGSFRPRITQQFLHALHRCNRPS
jgi:hypothetical protein